MMFDVRSIYRLLIVDTCSVWNILSSRRLFSATKSANLTMCITPAVFYECFFKRRGEDSDVVIDLRCRLEQAIKEGCFPVQECSLADLVYVSQLAPVKLSSGELSCIAVAYGIPTLVAMTDDKRARVFTENKLNLNVETTPRLYGRLHYHRFLTDSDHNEIIQEHEMYEKRPLTEFFKNTYGIALQERLKNR